MQDAATNTGKNLQDAGMQQRLPDKDKDMQTRCRLRIKKMQTSDNKDPDHTPRLEKQTKTKKAPTKKSDTN